MKAYRKTTIALSLSLALFGQAANAVLERTGPVDNTNGFPRWYQDTSGVALELCVPQNQGEVEAGSCLLLPGDLTLPEVFPTNFFDEHFWWAGEAIIDGTPLKKVLLVLALEAAFSADVAPGNQIAFARIRGRLEDVPVSGSYRFIHPFGEETIEGVAGDRIFFTDDVGIGSPGDFSGALTSRLGPFLLPSNTSGGAELPPVAGPVPGKLYIADPGREGPVTGSTLPPFLGSDGQLHDHNVFRVEGPPGSNLDGQGNDFIETRNFSLMGRLYSGAMPGRVTADRASYARTAAGQKVDVFATAFPTSASRIPGQPRPPATPPVTSFYNLPCGSRFDNNNVFLGYTAPTGGEETLMTAQNNARWGQIRPASGTPLPDSVCMKDNSAVDINGVVIPVYHQMAVKDEVRITDAYFDPVAATLAVSAVSSDEVAPPTLTLTEFNVPLSGGVITVPNVLASPSRVHVLSSARGVGEFIVATGAAGAAGGSANVVADSDSAATGENAAVTIPVIVGDTLNGVQINPAATPVTLAIIGNGTKGTAVVNNASGAINYTPTAGANGSDTFTYTVTVNGVTSNIATVTVNIGAVNDAPVGNADSASGAINTSLTISVLANDTDPDGDALSIAAGSLTAIVGPAGSTSSLQANGDGTLRFTGNRVGVYRFNYRATDGVLATPAIPVTVTLAAAETLSAPAGDYVAGKSRWKLNGTTSIAAAHQVTLMFSGACNASGRVIGTTTTTAGAYAFDIRNATGALDPRTTNCTALRVESTLGGVSPNGTFRLKN